MSNEQAVLKATARCQKIVGKLIARWLVSNATFLPQAVVRSRPPGRRGPEDSQTGALASCFISEAALDSSCCRNCELISCVHHLGKHSKVNLAKSRQREESCGEKDVLFCFEVCSENRLDQLDNRITFRATDRLK